MTPVAHPVKLEDDLVDRLTAEMRDRWQAGDRVITENILARCPELQSDPGAVGELIFEEICLRRECGESGISEEVLRRFPHLAPQVRVLLAVRDALEPDPEPIDLVAGDRVGEFVIVRELGRGLRGSVFQAIQPSLSDRSVVLKITRRATSEHSTLARLQHTNIVPLYTAFDDPIRHVHVLCMPDFGGKTLAQVLDCLCLIPPAERTAAEMWTALTGNSGSFKQPVWWARSEYTEVVCRIGICVAEALQFAHERNLLHLDVKPSNVLLTSEGLPMLLDFHLAREPISAGDPTPFSMGGTESYLSPEHRALMESVRENRAVSGSVDGRADVYSLGVVLYEALAGQLPASDFLVPLTQLNRRVSTGLSDIICRCLAPRSCDRYSEATSLAEDLGHHLAGQPLKGVRNRSATERWRKWRKRRPFALGSIVGLAALLLGSASIVGYVNSRMEQVRTALVEGRTEFARGQNAAARGAFQRGLAVGKYLPAWGSHTEELNRGIRQVVLADRLGELHAVAERLRGVLGTDDVSIDEIAAAETLGRLIGDRRSELFDAVGAATPDLVRQQAKADALDLVLLWSHLMVRITPPERASTACQEALELLNEAERSLGSHSVLALERAEYLDALGRPDEARAARKFAEESPPQSSTDYYALGCFFFRSGKMARAWEAFNRVIELDPRSYWGWYYLGRFDFTEGRFVDSVVAFGVCTGLDPNNPLGYIQKALVQNRLGQRDSAIHGLDQALQLDPNNATAIRLRNELTRIP